MGPFSGNHLQQFVSSNVCQHVQLVCHGPSTVWMPLWLVLQLVGLEALPAQDMPAHTTPIPARPMQRRQPAAEPQQQGSGPAEPSSAVLRQPMRGSTAAGTPPQQQKWPAARSAAGNNNNSAGRRNTAQHTKSSAQQASDDDDEDYGYGVSSEWLKKVKAVEAATKARQLQGKQQRQSQQGQEAAQHQRTQLHSQHSRQDHQQQQPVQQEESWEDTEMEDVSEAVLAAVSQLRGDQEYLEELHRAIDMDWEPVSVRCSDSQQLGAAAGQLTAAGAAQAVPCSAVDLAALPAGTGRSTVAMAGGGFLQEQEGLVLVLVLDTNVLLEKKLMRFLRQLQHLQQQQGGRILLQMLAQAAQGGSYSSHGSSSIGGTSPASMSVRVQAVVPWTVLVELDRLKMRVGSVANEAKAAVEDLRSEVVMPHDKSGGVFVMQSLQDFCQAAKQFDFGMPANDLVGDDRILQCALSQMKQLQERQHSQQGFAAANGWSQSGVLLLSNDKVMQLKARANGAAVAGLYDIPQLSVFATAGQLLSAHDTEPLQQRLACMVRMVQLAGVNPPWLPAVAASTAAHSQRQPVFTPASVSLRDPAHAHTSAQQAAAGNGLYGSPRGPPKHSSMALDNIALYGGSPRANTAQHKLRNQHAQEDQNHHQQQHTVQELSAATASFLTFLRLTLASQVEGWFRQDLEDMWTDVLLNKPPWNDLQFLEVLGHHFSSTIKAHLAPTEKKKAGHIMTVIHNLLGMAKRVHKQHFKGIELSKLPFNVGVRVMEVLNAFGAQEAAQQVQAALSAAAAAGPTSSSDKVTPAAAVPSMQAYLDSAALRTAAPALAPAPAPAQAGSMHTMGNGDASHAPTDSMQDGQLLQRQQQQHHTQQHSNAATVAALAAAAAAVPAPQPVGSCLTLSQLLMYAVSLLQAVLPLLGQGLSDAAAAAVAAAGGGVVGMQSATATDGVVAAGLAYEQQLRAVVQQLEQLGQHVGQGAQQHWQHHQQHWQETLHQEVLQMGLRLVELCSCLLKDEAARSAVSQQLMLHANEFVNEAAGYLVQNQQQQGVVSNGPAVMLQRLTAALQHLQQLLTHAMQRQ